MHPVYARNVNDALLQGLNIFRHYRHDKGMLREVAPRGQRRIELRVPYVTIYRNPCERVLFHPVRDCNPFFHLMESLWILAGREDVRWLAQWLPSIKDYSDNGDVFHGAYGGRIHTQIQAVIDRLYAEPNSTRCVLQVYNAYLDMRYTGRDMPCNTTIYLQLRDGVLDITVCNRSNDLIWGAYGANAVQFSMLQEYIASALGAMCGHYVQFSNNTHIYPDNEATKRCMEGITEMRPMDPYERGEAQPYPLVVKNFEQWDDDLQRFVSQEDVYRVLPYKEPFFEWVVMPMATAHNFYRMGKFGLAMRALEDCAASDWRKATQEWVMRRESKHAAKKAVDEATKSDARLYGHGAGPDALDQVG